MATAVEIAVRTARDFLDRERDSQNEYKLIFTVRSNEEVAEFENQMCRYFPISFDPTVQMRLKDASNEKEEAAGEESGE